MHGRRPCCRWWGGHDLDGCCCHCHHGIVGEYDGGAGTGDRVVSQFDGAVQLVEESECISDQ